MTPQQFVTSGDVQLAVYRWGEAGNRPTVVMVHGYPDNAGVWQQCAQQLAAQYHVVAYDVRGAGRSSRPRKVADYALEHLVRDLGAVLDAVSPQRPVHLLCHDWGSIQCWEAVTGDALRGRIASYTSISGPGLDHAGAWFLSRIKSGSPKKIAQVARQLGRSWYMFMFQLPLLAPAVWKLSLGKRWPAILHRLEGVRAERSATQTEDGCDGIKLYRANFLRRVFAPRPRTTTVPVQLIVAARDPYVSAQLFDDLVQWAPKLLRREIDGRHWLPLSHPQQIAQWTAEFVADIERGDQALEPPAASKAGGRRAMPA